MQELEADVNSNKNYYHSSLSYFMNSPQATYHSIKTVRQNVHYCINLNRTNIGWKSNLNLLNFESVA